VLLIPTDAGDSAAVDDIRTADQAGTRADSDGGEHRDGDGLCAVDLPAARQRF